MTLLPQSSSTNGGADLWIIPDFKHSQLAPKLDWYLNFQLNRSANKAPHVLGEELVSLLRKCGLPESHYSQRRERLLIHSSHLLPNRWVVQLDEFSGVEDWCKKIVEIWTGLRKPSLRVFLPTGLSSGDFLTTWKQIQSFDDFSVVVD